jgi:hypothetical protein
MSGRGKSASQSGGDVMWVDRCRVQASRVRGGRTARDWWGRSTCFALRAWAETKRQGAGSIAMIGHVALSTHNSVHGGTGTSGREPPHRRAGPNPARPRGGPARRRRPPLSPSRNPGRQAGPAWRSPPRGGRPRRPMIDQPAPPPSPLEQRFILTR